MDAKIVSQDDSKCLYLKTKVIPTKADDFTAPVTRNTINVKEFANQIN